MIFVTVGSQKIPFDRLLRALDDLLEAGEITDEVIAQTGSCTYVPKHMKAIPYMNGQEFTEYLQKAEIVISHGGEGSLVGALTLRKKVIAVPRLARYGEHVDDHQLEVPGAFATQNYLTLCMDPMKLPEAIKEAREHVYAEYHSNPKPLIAAVDEGLQALLKG